jgi:hypothetical protein
MFARHLASTLWSGEKYYLQIDAHSSFNYAWDDMVIKVLPVSGVVLCCRVMHGMIWSSRCFLSVVWCCVAV